MKILKKIKEVALRPNTYTKRAVRILLVVGVINAEIPYLLSAFGKDPLEALGISWITEIVAVILGYLCKSYFETKQERKQNLEDFIAESEVNDE